VAASDDEQHEPATDPERVGLVWVGADRAVVVRWSDEPIVEHIESAVSPRRRESDRFDAALPDRQAVDASLATGRRANMSRSYAAS
jgi:hypothetical protein